MSETRTCPHCGGEIKAAAKLCKHCREAVEPATPTQAATTPAVAQKPEPVSTPSPPPQPAPQTAGPLSNAVATSTGLQTVSTGTVIGLSIPTLGIYGMVQFYRCVDSYRRLLSAKTNFDTWFYLFIGGNVLGLVVAIGSAGMGWLATILPTTLFGALALNEALKLRAQVISNEGLTVTRAMETTHLAVWIVGELLTAVVVGIAGLIVQGIWFFEEHNRIAVAGGWASMSAGALTTGNVPARPPVVSPQVVTPPIAAAPRIPPSESAAGVDDPVEQALRNLARLHEQGLVTDEEYEKKRAEILSRI